MKKLLFLLAVLAAPQVQQAKAAQLMQPTRRLYGGYKKKTKEVLKRAPFLLKVVVLVACFLAAAMVSVPVAILGALSAAFVLIGSAFSNVAEKAAQLLENMGLPPRVASALGYGALFFLVLALLTSVYFLVLSLQKEGKEKNSVQGALKGRLAEKYMEEAPVKDEKNMATKALLGSSGLLLLACFAGIPSGGGDDSILDPLSEEDGGALLKEKLRNLSRRNSVLLQQSSTALVGDPSSDEEESERDGQDDIFAASSNREASIASLSDVALYQEKNKLERKISALEKDNLFLNDQNEDENPQTLARRQTKKKKKKKASFEIQGGKKLLSNEEIEKAWLLAAKQGENAKLDYLYQTYGLDINAKNNDGWNALLFAAYEGKNSTIDYLMKGYGLRVQAKDKEGWNALLVAAYGGQDETLDHLVKTYGLDINAKDEKGNNALLVAARSGQNGTVDHLVKTYGLDPNAKANSGNNALLVAARWGQNGTVDHLVKTYGLDINAKNNEGWNALLFAAYGGQNSTIDYLAKTYRMDPNVKTNSGSNAVKNYFQRKMDPNVKANNGENAISLARANGKAATVEHLKSLGVKDEEEEE
jgi:ankyrin repeat protein